MKSNIYDIINKIQRWLPALGVFYLTIATIWVLPYGDEVNKTLVAIATLIAAYLEIDSAIWNKKHEIQIIDISGDLKNDR